MYVYGPIPSRRLGKSLGVSPIPPKTCSYSCVYCQLGRTTDLTSTRRSFFKKEDILDEILQRSRDSVFDYITFVGDGEPTLCRDLGWLIKNTGEAQQAPMAVITNGSLLFLDDVRSDLSHADIVMPTLDAGNERTFRTVNRPHRGINFDNMLQGIVAFRHEFKGHIWLEVMLVKGVNDTAEELESIKKAVDLIGPDRLYIVTPIRPPAESWVEPPDPETIIMAQKIIGQAIAIADREDGAIESGKFENARQAILEIGARHPLRRDQAIEIERTFEESGIVEQMLKAGELTRTEYESTIYLLPGHFVRGRSYHRDKRRQKQ